MLSWGHVIYYHLKIRRIIVEATFEVVGRLASRKPVSVHGTHPNYTDGAKSPSPIDDAE